MTSLKVFSFINSQGNENSSHNIIIPRTGKILTEQRVSPNMKQIIQNELSYI